MIGKYSHYVTVTRDSNGVVKFRITSDFDDARSVYDGTKYRMTRAGDGRYVVYDSYKSRIKSTMTIVGMTDDEYNKISSSDKFSDYTDFVDSIVG